MKMTIPYKVPGKRVINEHIGVVMQKRLTSRDVAKEAGTIAMAYNINCPMKVTFEDAHEGESSRGIVFCKFG